MKLSHLILKKVTEGLSKEEEELFQEWLRESETNQKLYNFLKVEKQQGKDVSKLKEWDSDSAWVNVNEKYELIRKRKQNHSGQSQF